MSITTAEMTRNLTSQNVLGCVWEKSDPGENVDTNLGARCGAIQHAIRNKGEETGTDLDTSRSAACDTISDVSAEGSGAVDVFFCSASLVPCAP